MRVLAVLPTWGPAPPTGAHVTSREFVHGLAAAGHQVEVVTTTAGTPARDGDGVRAWPLGYWWRAVQAVQPELVISHHGDRRAPAILAQMRGVPHLLLVHGMSANRQLGRPALVWFPSEACRAHYPAYRGPWLVSPPPIAPDRYQTTPGQFVTLNGSSTAKGADVLAAVAEQLSDTRFLVVRAPGRQAPLDLPNVELADRMEPRDLYARTRLLLMPSVRESYGRVGVEAMLSGIPVIAAPLPGIREALGDAAVYVPREDPARWAAEIRRLTDPAAYAEAAAAARARAAELDHASALRAFTTACERVRRPSRTSAARRPEPPLERPDVVAWVHFSVPYRRAGSETMLQTMLRALQTAGLRVLVVVSQMPEAPATWDVDGIAHRKAEPPAARALIRALRPRVVVTHHCFAERAITLAREIRARSLLLLHSDFDLNARELRLNPDMVVYNTDWVVKSLSPRYPQVDRIRRLVVHPPVVPGEHRAEAAGGQHVTLVNLSRDKGVETWLAAARLCRELPFLGVTGAYGEQVTDLTPPNARVSGHTSDMRGDVWAHTRVLLVPSIYESYGMAAVEALASGIPVIAHPTPGLREALGDAAVFVDRGDVPRWASAIRALHRDGDRRDEATAAALARSAYLADQARAELKAWVEAVQSLVSR
ncbi:glycosyltransferase family 4 protein [Streptomyces misionensis]|uniref:glycosyltransferase family 4 protein n=1 Tax=Streptomyces misionensis TaxID=67331 RepID=UPI0033AB7FAF